MADNLDLYLKKRIKGWAARQPVPADGRSELLRSAALDSAVRRNTAFSLLSSLHQRISNTNPELIYSYSHIFFHQPFTLSEQLSFHMVLNQRLAT